MEQPSHPGVRATPVLRRPRVLGSRTLHRTIATLLSLAFVYLAVSGSIIQTIDLVALLSHRQATDPDVMATRESIDGPSNFAVIGPRDYEAPVLSTQFDYASALGRVVAVARKAAPLASVRYAELRVFSGRPAGEVMVGRDLLRIDAASGALLARVPQIPGGPPARSAHLLAKRWHRFWILGDWMLWLDALFGIGLGVVTVSGVRVYWTMLQSHRRAGRRKLLWHGPPGVRAAHRLIAICASALILVVAVSGTLLSIDSFCLQIAKATHPDQMAGPNVLAGMVGDYSSPLTDRDLSTMLVATLRAYRKAEPGRLIEALRLRTFAGMRQGVVISGGGPTRQYVYDSRSGVAVTSSEPSYPMTGFPFGWHEHEIMKEVHRGDIIGLPGRVLDLLAGLSLLFLAASGLSMYWDLYGRRRRGGRKALLWR